MGKVYELTLRAQYRESGWAFTVTSLAEASGERAEALEDVEVGGVHIGREKTQEEKKRKAEEVATERLAAKRLAAGAERRLLELRVRIEDLAARFALAGQHERALEAYEYLEGKPTADDCGR